MRINWISYYIDYDGYGRFSSRLVRAMQEFGLDVLPLTSEDLDRPQWMLDQMGINWDDFNISCTLPKGVRKIPGNGTHWLYTMCESTLLPKSTIRYLHSCNLQRLLVPCQHNLEAFKRSGLKIPISVVHLGTDPNEFPLIEKREERPYTFLTLADRGTRKGWQEVYEAFYVLFRGKTDGIKDVRLIIKSIPKGNPLLDLIARAEDMDSRIVIDRSLYRNMADFYKQGDCLVLPSRCEGWGMPHREAAMMGLPVITQKYAGIDDGHADTWSLTVKGGTMKPMPKRHGSEQGEWMIANKHRLADAMRFCYYEPDKARIIGESARAWLSTHQTWRDAAATMIELIGDEVGYASSERNRINGYAPDQVRGTNGEVSIRSFSIW